MIQLILKKSDVIISPTAPPNLATVQQVENREFDNRSAGIRKCIEIARRVYENATPEEIVKFIHGKNIEGS
jgi:hypothetical protein